VGSERARAPALEPSAVRSLLGPAVVLGVAVSLSVALRDGNPGNLPGVALGSSALLCVEKATACFTAYLLFLVVVVRAFAGELPSELRGVRYEAQGDRVAVRAMKEAGRTSRTRGPSEAPKPIRSSASGARSMSWRR
jgi:hypothetical protein